MGLSPTVRRHILAHERTHLDKGDHWIKLIGFLALALHWFNPLVWLSYVLLCKDMEMACDERVVQFMELEERKSYSAARIRFPCPFPSISSPEYFVTVVIPIPPAYNESQPAFSTASAGDFEEIVGDDQLPF